MKVFVTVPAGRGPGKLEATDEAGEHLGSFPALAACDHGAAREHGNPDADPLLPFGPTPAGLYDLQLTYETESELHEHEFGQATAKGIPFFLMKPRAGPAIAAQQNGRKGLGTHAGAPSATGGLRPTHGCIRTNQAGVDCLVQSYTGQDTLLLTVQDTG